MEITPLEVMHYKLPVFGYRIGNFCYITDVNFIPEKTAKKLENAEIFICKIEPTDVIKTTNVVFVFVGN